MILQFGGVRNAVSFLQMVRLVGIHERKLLKLAKRMDVFFATVDKHRIKKEGNTMIDHLLCLQKLEPENYTDQIIKGLVMVSILAGTDTSVVTLEWIMANLLNHSKSAKEG